MLNAALSKTVALCTRHARSVVLLAIAIVAAATYYTATHFAISTDVAKLFSPDLPWRQRAVAFDAAFAQSIDRTVLVIDGATPEAAERAAARLASELAKQPALFRSVQRPDGGIFFARNGLLFLSPQEVSRTTEQLIAAQPLLGSLAADPSVRGLMEALALVLEGVQRGEAKLADLARPLDALAVSLETVTTGHPQPLSWRSLITGEPPSRRELRRFVLVQPLLDFAALQPGAKASDAIRHIVRTDPIVRETGARVRLTGSVPMADDEFATVAEGAALNAIITLLVVLLWLWLALRSIKLIIAVLLSVAAGLMVTAAFGLLVAAPLNLISVAFAVLFVGLGIDFAIQFCVRLRAEQQAFADLPAALRAAAMAIGSPLALAAAAIAAGFYAFLPTEYRGVSELGLIAGTGMLIAFIATITLLPALLTLLRPKAAAAEVGYPALARADRFIDSHRKSILLSASAIAIVCASLLPWLRFDSNPMSLRSPKVESVAALLELMQDRDTSPNTLDVLAPSREGASALADRLAALPEVARALTLSSFVPNEQEQKLALISDAALLLDPTLNPAQLRSAPSDADNARAMEHTAAMLQQTTRDLAGAGVIESQRLARVLTTLSQAPPTQRALADSALIPGLQTMLGQLREALQASPVSLQSLPQDLVRDWVAADGRARIQVSPKGDSNDDATLRRFVAAVQQIAPDATGPPVSVQASGRTIVHAFVVAGGWAFIAIVVLLSLTLRRASDVLRMLAPLALSALLTLGICVAAGQPLNFANIIALPLLFGIGVAFDIYYVMAWRAGGRNLLQSSLTRAVVFSALTTGTAFGSLWLSHHPGTASMGKLLALSLASTLVSALLFLPALLGPTRDDTGRPTMPSSKPPAG